MVDGEFEQAVEQHPPAARSASVEPEHEFVHIVGQVRVVDGSLVGAEQPSLGQRGDAVDARKKVLSAPTCAGGALAVSLVDVADPGPGRGSPATRR